MAHHEAVEENMTHEEIKYHYHIQRGIDFTRIDLFRTARENYKMALKYKPSDPLATEKIKACNDQIRHDKKKVLIIVPVVIAIIALAIFLIR